MTDSEALKLLIRHQLDMGIDPGDTDKLRAFAESAVPDAGPCECRMDADEPNPFCPIHGGERRPASEGR